MRLTLHVVSRNVEPFDLHVEIDSYTIGRSSNADLVMRDPSISRRHARLYREGDQLFLEDLDSHNGTWLCGKPVHGTVPLTMGDEVEFARDPDREACALKILLKPFADLVRGAGVMDTQETIVRDVRELVESQAITDLHTIHEADELRDHAERLRILNDVHNAMSTSKNTSELLDLILDRIFRFLEPESAGIFLENEAGRLVPTAQRSADGVDARPVFSETLVRQISEGGKALLVHDALHDMRFSAATSLHMEGVRSLVASPMVDGEGSLGLIMLYSRGVFGQFSERDMALLVSLASVATLRIRNLRLVEAAQSRLERMVEEQTRELNARKEELETLDAIVRTINMEHSLERVLRAVLEQGSVLFPQAEKAVFLLRTADTDTFRVGATMGYDDGLQSLALSESVAVARYAAPEAEIEHGVYLAENVGGMPEHELDPSDLPKSMLVMTMVLDGRLEGFVIFDNFSDAGFSRSDLRRLGRFRDHAASAVAKARLLHSLEQKTEEIAHRQNQLLLREKMASLGHLTAGVSHEINNPNNFIYGGAQNIEVFLRDFKTYLYDLAGDDLDEDLRGIFDGWFTKMQAQVDTILLGSKRINGIVADLQLVSRLDESARKRVDLLHSLSATVNLMEPNFYHVAFNCDFRGPLEISCYPAELNQVFMNIIVNACEAMEPDAEAAPESGTHGTLRIQAMRQGEEALIRFTDTGPGIEDKHMPRLFEAFYTTKAPGDNTGLGLYTCYKIIEKHQGSLELSSQPGRGTTVSVRLPLEPGDGAVRA